MNEVIYPLSAVLLLYFVVIPILTVAAHALLLRRARSFSEVQDWGAAWVWTAIVAPVLLPVSWWIVDVMHQIGDHHTLEACLTPHADGGCAESFILGILVVTPVVFRLFRTRFSAPKGARWVPNDPRVQSLRVYMVTDLCDPIATRGLLDPWIGLREDALALLGHEELVVALLHEAEHVRGRDPLRRWLAGLAFSLNPAGYLLEPYFSRWELGREAICDLEAAARGDRFALAQALVRVARLNLVPASHADAQSATGRRPCQRRAITGSRR